MARLSRWIGFGALVGLATSVFFLAAPTSKARPAPADVESTDELIEQALADYQQNVAAAGEDAELQQITNGWVARDLLFIISEQLGAQSQQLAVLSAQTAVTDNGTDDRIAMLLVIIVAAIGFHGLAARSGPPRVPGRSRTEDFMPASAVGGTSREEPRESESRNRS